MIDDTIAKIEALFRDSAASDDKKHDLLALTQTLKSELNDLAKTQPDQVDQIADELHPDTDSSIGNSIEKFEATHPRLVETINEICVALSNLGI